MSDEEVAVDSNDVFGDSDNDEVDSEEEEEIEEEERGKSGKRKKTSKSKNSKSTKRQKAIKNLFLDEADVAEDEDEEEDEYDDVYAGERKEVVLPEEHKRAQKRVEDRHRMTKEFYSRSDADIAKDYEERFKTSRNVREDIVMGAGISGGQIGTRGGSSVLQQSLLPGIGDPSVFYVKCKPGMEQLLTRSIFLKVLDMKSKGQLVHIMSAFSTSAKGYIYVEATAEPFAREAIAGLRGIYQTSFGRVPVNQMVQILNVHMTKTPLKIGQYVRMKRGPLKGDLAKVVDLIDGGESVFVQAIPRPDYSIKDGSKASRAASASAAAGASRPVQRLFNPEEARQNNCDIGRQKHPSYMSTLELYDVWNGEYFKGGYLYKEVKADYLSAVSVNPRLEELKMFAESKNPLEDRDDDSENEGSDREKAEDEDATAITAQSYIKQLAEQIQGNSISGSANKTVSEVPYVVGDLVQVIGGDLKSLVGKVKSISEVHKIVVIQTLHEAFDRELPIEISLLAKYIKPGQHVKVVQGRYGGQTGRVVGLKSDGRDLVAAVLTDTVNTEILVNISHLQVSSDVATGLDSLGGYEMYDFVVQSPNEYGVVIGIGTEKLSIMNQNGIILTVKPMELQGKRNMQSSRAHAFDASHNTIGSNDVVNVVDGPHAKKTGTIKHLSKSQLWLHSNLHLRDAGIFVVRARNVVLAGNKQKGTQFADGYMGMLTPQTASAPSPSQRSAPGQNGQGPPGRGRNAPTDVGKTVRICKGAFKGHMAQVVDATDTHYNVELLTQMKKITIEKSKTVIVGDNKGSFDKKQEYVGTEFPGSFVSTPYLTSETPRMSGSETPSHYNLGNETPARTPMRDDDMDVWGVSAKDSMPQTYDTGYVTPQWGWDESAPKQSSIHYNNWVEKCIVIIKSQNTSSLSYLNNRQAMIRVPPASDGMTKIQLLRSDGSQDDGSNAVIDTHANNLILLEPKQKSKVIVLGSGSNFKKIGIVNGIKADDALVKVTSANSSSSSMISVKLSNLACLYE